MSWNFDTLFFLGFGCLALFLGFSGSRWLFWGGTSHERLEKQLGAGYRKIINLLFGFVCLTIGFYFMFRDS